MPSLMTGKLSKTLLAAFAMLLPTGECLAAASSYCVQRVGLNRVPSAERFRQSRGPSNFLFADKAATPLAIDTVKERVGPDHHFNRQVLWRFAPDLRFEGPYDFPSYELSETDGTSFYLFRSAPSRPRSEHGNAPIKVGEDEIYVITPDGLPQIVKGPWTGQGWNLQRGRFDANLGSGPIDVRGAI